MESAAQRKHRVATNGFSDTASDSLTLDTPLGNSSALSNACPDAKADAATLTAAEPAADASTDGLADDRPLGQPDVFTNDRGYGEC